MLHRTLVLAILACASTLHAQASVLDKPVIEGFRSPRPGAQPADYTASERAGDGWFEQFNAGINAFGSDGLKAGMEMGTLARLFRLTIKETRREVPAPEEFDPDRKAVVVTKKYLYLAVLNRAAINLDSLRNLALEYVSSLQASPLTLRVYVDKKLTNRDQVTFGTVYPDVSVVLQLDGRAVPYAGAGGNVDVGATAHAFGTLKIQFKTDEIDEDGNTIDTGASYFEPSFFIAKANSRLAETLFTDGKDRPFQGVELRIGYRSDKDKGRDLGALFQWTWQDLIGPSLRAGFTITK